MAELRISIPNENVKMQIIGREGRFIKFFEAEMAANIVVDNTPLTVFLKADDENNLVRAKSFFEHLI